MRKAANHAAELSSWKVEVTILRLLQEISSPFAIFSQMLNRVIVAVENRYLGIPMHGAFPADTAF